MALFTAQSPSSGASPDDVSALLAQLGIGPGGSAGQGAPAPPSNAQQVAQDAASMPISDPSQGAPVSLPGGQAPQGDSGPLGAILAGLRGAIGGGQGQGQTQSQPDIPPGFVAPPPVRAPVGPLEAIGDFALGGLPSRIKDANYQRQVEGYEQQAGMAQLRRAYSAVQQAAQSGALSGTDLAAAMNDPMSYVQNLDAGMKARMTTALKPGEFIPQGADGSPVINYTTGVDAPSGRGFTSNPTTGQTAFGPSAGGDYAEDTSGNVVSKRTGQAGPSVPIYQNFAPGNFHGFVQSGSPVQGGATAAGAPAQAGSGAAMPTGSGSNGAPANVGEALRMRWSGQGVPISDQAGLLATGKIESNFDPDAKNGSSRGLYQFQPATFKAVGGTNINDPGQQADAAAKLWAANRQSLTSTLGRAPSDAELYLAHQQGAGGAAALLKANPNQTAISALVQSGTYQNPAVARRAIMNNGGSRSTTAGQFVQHWADKFGQAQQAMGGQVAAGAPTQGGQVAGSGALGTENLAGGRPYGSPTVLPGSDDIVSMGPDGKPDKVGTVAYGQSAADGKYHQIADSKEYHEYMEANAGYSNIARGLAAKNGMSDYSMADNFIRLLNPGGVARAGNIQAVQESQGLPDKVKGELQSVFQHGAHFTPATRAFMEQTARGALQSRYDALTPQLNDGAAYAKAHNLSTHDVVPSVTAPPTAAPREAQAQAVLGQAQDAIARGAPRDAVIARMRKMGFDPSGL